MRWTVICGLSVLLGLTATPASAKPGLVEETCASVEDCVDTKRTEFQTRGTVGMLIHPLAVSAEGYGHWRIRQIMPDGPADVAGLEPEDVMLTWNGKPLPPDNDSGMTALLRALEIDDEVEIEVARGEQRLSIKLVAEGPSAQAIEYWLLLFVQENYSEEEFLAYEAAVEQRLIRTNDP